MQGTRQKLNSYDDYEPGNEINTLSIPYKYSSDFKEMLDNVKSTTDFFKRLYLDYVSKYALTSLALMPSCFLDGFKHYTGFGDEIIFGSTNVAGP